MVWGRRDTVATPVMGAPGGLPCSNTQTSSKAVPPLLGGCCRTPRRRPHEQSAYKERHGNFRAALGLIAPGTTERRRETTAAVTEGGDGSPKLPRSLRGESVGARTPGRTCVGASPALSARGRPHFRAHGHVDDEAKSRTPGSSAVTWLPSLLPPRKLRALPEGPPQPRPASQLGLGG